MLVLCWLLGRRGAADVGVTSCTLAEKEMTRKRPGACALISFSQLTTSVRGIGVTACNAYRRQTHGKPG
jgi:hypothetical protein